MPPAITFGAAGFGTRSDLKETEAQLDILRKHKIAELDTARIYGNGESEIAIGKLNAPAEFTITTKAIAFAAGAGKKDVLLKNAYEQFANLGVDRVRVYLLHCPDPATPISETLDAIQVLYKEGKFEKFGLSNFDADETRAVVAYAKEKGYVLPTIYQSNYNLVARHNETILFPVLKELGFEEIQAYSPSAGGFLIKTSDQIRNPIKGGRWDPQEMVGGLYHGMYNKPSLIKFLDEFNKLAEESGESKLSLAYRWVRYHSALGDKDKIIIGASSAQQLEETLKIFEEGPLDAALVTKLNAFWDDVKDEALVDNFQIAKQMQA